MGITRRRFMSTAAGLTAAGVLPWASSRQARAATVSSLRLEVWWYAPGGGVLG